MVPNSQIRTERCKLAPAETDMPGGQGIAVVTRHPERHEAWILSTRRQLAWHQHASLVIRGREQ